MRRGVFLLFFIASARVAFISVMAGAIKNPTRLLCCPCSWLSIKLSFVAMQYRGMELLPFASGVVVFAPAVFAHNAERDDMVFHVGGNVPRRHVFEMFERCLSNIF